MIYKGVIMVRKKDINTVKGYASFEQKVITDVTEMRSRWQSASTKEEKISAAGDLDHLLDASEGGRIGRKSF
jgi:hypothetical protein